MPDLYCTLIAPADLAFAPPEATLRLAADLLRERLLAAPCALLHAPRPSFPLYLDHRLPVDPGAYPDLQHRGTFDDPDALYSALVALRADEPGRALCAWFPAVHPDADHLIADLDLDDAAPLDCTLGLILNPTPWTPEPSAPGVESPWPPPLGPLPCYLELIGPRAPIDDEVLHSALARRLERAWGTLRAATSVPGMQRFDM